MEEVAPVPLPRAVVEDAQLSPRTPEQRGLDCPRWMAEEILSQRLNSWPEGRTGTASECPQRPPGTGQPWRLQSHAFLAALPAEPLCSSLEQFRLVECSAENKSPGEEEPQSPESPDHICLRAEALRMVIFRKAV